MEIAFKISGILIAVSYLIASVFIYFYEFLNDYRIHFLIVFVTIQAVSFACWLTGYYIRKEVLKELDIK